MDPETVPYIEMIYSHAVMKQYTALKLFNKEQTV